MDAGSPTTVARPELAAREGDRSPIDVELGRAYSEISTLSELVNEIDRRTQPLQLPDHGGFAQPCDDRPAASDLSPVARAVRDQRDQVAQINDVLRTVLAALQT